MTTYDTPPGTFRPIETHKDVVFRTVWKCPRCLTVFYDHYGLEGRKFKSGVRLRVTCEECERRWKDAFGHSFFARLQTKIPFPKQLLLAPAAK